MTEPPYAEPPDITCPSTVSYVIKDFIMVLVSTQDVSGNLIHVPPLSDSCSNTDIPSSSFTNRYPMQTKSKTKSITALIT